MRRKDKEITDFAVLEDVLEKALVCRIAFNGEDGPYIVPVNFGYRPGFIYAHSASEGKKIDLIRRDNRVCFEVETDVSFTPGNSGPCKWTTKYRSIIGFGKASIVTGLDEKLEALNIILGHYSPDKFEIPANACEKLVVIKIAIDSMTGKISGFPK